MIRSGLIICFMGISIFCLHRYYELTKTDLRDHVICHPLLLVCQSIIGICSNSQKITRLFSFGGKTERLLAAQALVESPHDIVIDHLNFLLGMIVDSNDIPEVIAAVKALSSVTDGRADISSAIMCHEKLVPLLRKLFQLQDITWRPILHHLYVRLASSIQPSERFFSESELIQLLVDIVLKNDSNESSITKKLQRSDALLLLSILSSHHSIAESLNHNKDFMVIVSTLATAYSSGSSSADNIQENDLSYAAHVLVNIDHVILQQSYIPREDSEPIIMQKFSIESNATSELGNPLGVLDISNDPTVVVSMNGDDSISSSRQNELTTHCSSEDCHIEDSEAEEEENKFGFESEASNMIPDSNNEIKAAAFSQQDIPVINEDVISKRGKQFKDGPRQKRKPRPIDELNPKQRPRKRNPRKTNGNKKADPLEY